MKNYDFLKSQYPEFVSLNQLYQICRISKRSARYLVQNKIIPCKECEGNKTWRYQLALDDVIAYLYRREQYGSMIPCGATTDPWKKQKSKQPAIRAATERSKEAYFKKVFADCPDTLLTVADLAVITGLCKATIRGFIRDKHLYAVEEGNIYYVLKPWFLDFAKSQAFIRCGGIPRPIRQLSTAINETKQPFRRMGFLGREFCCKNF